MVKALQMSMLNLANFNLGTVNVFTGATHSLPMTKAILEQEFILARRKATELSTS